MRLMEALRKAPVSEKQVKQFMEMMNDPIPLHHSIAVIHDIIDDDGLFDILQHESMKDPDSDARPIIADWVRQNHPSMIRNNESDDLHDGHWYMSPISKHPSTE